MDNVPTRCGLWAAQCDNEIEYACSELTGVYASMYSCGEHRDRVMTQYFRTTHLELIQVQKVTP